MPDEPSTATSAASDPEHKVTLENLHTQLAEAVARIETGDQWKAWLQFARGVNAYSFNNLILLWSQKPDASAVASYRSWQAKGRQVCKGEKSLRVLAPITRKTAALDPDQHPILNDEGKPQTRHRVVGFRPVPVFDISQTEGPDTPRPITPQLLIGAAPHGLWDALVDEAAGHGYQVLRASQAELHGANGVTNFKTREIQIRYDVDDAQAVKSLTHELGHVLLHAPETDEPQLVCAGTREVEAESVAYLVAAVHGIDTTSYTFPYVAHWAYAPAAAEHVPMADIVTKTGTRVMDAAHQLITATEQATPQADLTLSAIADRTKVAVRETEILRDETRAEASGLQPVSPLNRAAVVGVLEDSQEFFAHQLPRSWVPDYLSDRRLGDATHSHELGYAPCGWTTLVDHLRDLGYADRHIEGSGMASRARGGNLVDRFRDRLMIPVRDEGRELVAFVGRNGPDQGEDRFHPKYINSPRTVLYNKGAVLYGLAQHDNDLRRHRAVVCEGPLDAIAVDLAGRATNIPLAGIAASGTAFTPRHAELLAQAASGQPICLALDADRAGQTATHSAWRQLTETGPHPVTVAKLPPGTDPAELVSSGRSEALGQAVANARPAGIAIADGRIDRSDLAGNPARQLAAFRDLLGECERVPLGDRIPYVLHIANQLDIDPEVAAAEVAKREGPNTLMDRVITHCRELDKVRPPEAMDHLAIQGANTPISRAGVS